MCELLVDSWLENVAGRRLSALLLTTGPKFSESSRKVPIRTPSALAILISDDNDGILSLEKVYIDLVEQKVINNKPKTESKDAL